ncbi:MAG: metallophosphoesterase [Oligoflexia bacterium]|nr:metallophosphoesterase [Oligoflexia bacterium]
MIGKIVNKKIIIFITVYILFFLNVFAEEKNTCANGYRVIGDLHGMGHEIINLLDGYIDKDGNWIGEKNHCLIFVGDYIDRGEYSWETYNYVSYLQAQAIKNGQGKVIRLLGNHELLIFKKDFRNLILNGACSWFNKTSDDFKTCEWVNTLISKEDLLNKDALYFIEKIFTPLVLEKSKQLKKDIEQGNIVAAFDFKNNKEDIVVTHAGISDEVCEAFADESSSTCFSCIFGKKPVVVTATNITKWLNTELVYGAFSNDHDHVIYSQRYGIFWNRLKSESGAVSKFCSKFSQIRGHTIKNEITIDTLEKDKLLYSIDVGLYENSNKEYLDIDPIKGTALIKTVHSNPSSSNKSKQIFDNFLKNYSIEKGDLHSCRK